MLALKNIVGDSIHGFDQYNECNGCKGLEAEIIARARLISANGQKRKVTRGYFGSGVAVCLIRPYWLLALFGQEIPVCLLGRDTCEYNTGDK